MRRNHQHGLDYYSYISGMRQWNSTLKACFSLGALITVIAMNSIKISILTLVFMCALSVLMGKIHVRDYIRLLAIPLVFIMMSGVAIMLQIGGDTSDCVKLWSGIPLSITIFHTRFLITKQGFWLAVNVGLKALGAVSAMYMLTLSTPLSDILGVLRNMHVPELIIELMHLIYRYFFILSDVNHMQNDAAASRLGYTNYRTSIRSFSNGLANLLIMSLKRAHSCYDAMEARGYDGTLRIMEEEHKVTYIQIIWVVGYVLLIVGSCIIWR